MTATTIAAAITAQADPLSFDLDRFWALYAEMTDEDRGGSDRLAAFSALPPTMQTIAWRALADQTEAGR